MTEKTVGMAVKRADDPSKYPDVGVILEISDGIARVKFGQRYFSASVKDVAVAMLVQVCGRMVFTDYSSHICGRTVKEDGLCGIHLGARKRQEKADAARKAEGLAREEEHRRIEGARAAMQAQLDKYMLADRVRVQSVNDGTVSLLLSELLVMIGAW